MAIKEDFQDNTELRIVREEFLNPALKQINANDAKILGLQAIVYKSFIKGTLDDTTNTLTFETGDGNEEELDFTPMLTKWKHGVDINKKGSPTKPNIELLSFSGNVDVTDITDGVEISIPEMKGEVDATSPETSIKKVLVRGNKGASAIDTNGVLTIDLPDQSIVPPPAANMEGQIGTGTPAKIKKVQIMGYTTGSTLTNETLSINVPDYTILQGKIGGAPSYQDVRQLRLTGNTGTSSFTGGEMVMNIPYLLARKDVHAFGDVSRIQFTGYTDNVLFNGTTMEIVGVKPLSVLAFGDVNPTDRVTEITFANSTVQVTPDGADNKVVVTPLGIKGKVDPDTTLVPISNIHVTGNKGASIIDKGNLTIDLPQMKASPDGTDVYEDVNKIKLAGNRGTSNVTDGVLTIDLPAGGGGGGSTIYGKIDTGAPEEITTVKITGEVTSSSLGGGTLTIDIPAGGGGSITGEVDKTTGVVAETITKVSVTGDNDTSKVEGGTLTIDIPTPAISVGVQGGTPITSVNELEFKGATVAGGGSSAPHKALVVIPEINAKVSTQSGTLESIEVIGKSLGGSGFHDGKLTIDLQSGGGGGGGGSGITGIIGSTQTELSRIQVTGYVDESSVDPNTGSMTVTLPKRPAIASGSTILENIEIVEVAQSKLELKMESGRRKAFITPQVAFFYLGWFGKMSDLETAAGPAEKRIPTKTCGHVVNPTTGQVDFWMWMPDITGGSKPPEWVQIKPTSALELFDGGKATAPICSVKKNPMVQVDNKGELEIVDTTTPNVRFDIMNENGGTVVKGGRYTKIKYMDGEGTAHFDSNTSELSVFRAQRRLDMGDSPDTTATAFNGTEFEGSLFMNKTDKCWWGYSGKDALQAGYKRWTRVIHPYMSDHVSSLNERVSEYLPQITTLDSTKDNPLWNKSGWTGVSKNAPSGILPSWAQGQQGMVIQTFVGPSGSGVAPREGRLQIGYMGADASMYKRFRDETDDKWSEWAQMSFNSGDLARHNQDKSAHRLTHPFYQVCGFGCRYKDLADISKKGPLYQYVLENEREYGLLASSGSPFAKDSVGIKVPYKSKYQIRGIVYLGGPSDLPNKSIKGDWVIELQKCLSSSSIFNTIYTHKYQHHTTTLKYPPVSFNFDQVDMDEGDFLRLKVQFKPDAGSTESQFLAAYPELWFMPGRSFFSVDVEGTDTGYCIGNTMSRMYGGFSPLGGGAFGYATGTWPNDTGHIVGDGIETPVLAGP